MNSGKSLPIFLGESKDHADHGGDCFDKRKG
jgi:hypothetical protein